MRKTLFFFVFLGLWTQTFGQKYDKFVTGNDTTTCQIKIAHKKGEIVVLFKKSYQTEWNEIYAENADEVFVSDKSLFVSMNLPDIPKKVWTKCFFDGTYKLFQYRKQFYIAEPGKLTKLIYRKRETASGKIFEMKTFVGQMIQILNEKIEYDFNSLSYNSESLVLPLIEYHEKHQLPFHDYNDYIKTFLNWGISGGYSQDNHVLLTQLTNSVYLPDYPTRSIDMPGYSMFIAANMNLYFPQLSNRLFFSGGIEVSNTKIDALTVKSFTVKSFSNNAYYFNLSYRGMNLSFPFMIGFKIIQNPKIAISLATGLKVMKEFSLDKSLRIEIEKDDVIKTEMPTLTSNSEFILLHDTELVLNLPILSKAISLGTAYNYSLANKNEGNNVFSLDRSLSIFARYTF